MTLTDENFTGNDVHEGGGSENGAGWDPNGERELDIRPSKTSVLDLITYLIIIR